MGRIEDSKTCETSYERTALSLVTVLLSAVQVGDPETAIRERDEVESSISVEGKVQDETIQRVEGKGKRGVCKQGNSGA